MSANDLEQMKKRFSAWREKMAKKEMPESTRMALVFLLGFGLSFYQFIDLGVLDAQERIVKHEKELSDARGRFEDAKAAPAIPEIRESLRSVRHVANWCGISVEQENSEISSDYPGVPMRMSGPASNVIACAYWIFPPRGRIATEAGEIAISGEDAAITFHLIGEQEN